MKIQQTSLSVIFLEELTVADTLRNLLSAVGPEFYCCLYGNQQIRQSTPFTTPKFHCQTTAPSIIS